MGEFVSQSKFFVDLPGVGLLGAVGSSGTSRQLQKVKSADVKSDADVEVLTAVGVDQGAGFRDKVGGGEISLQVYRETGKSPEVDWRQVKLDRKVFTFTIQDEQNGLRESFTCRVAKVEGKDDDQGVHEDSVSLKYTKRYKS